MSEASGGPGRVQTNEANSSRARDRALAGGAPILLVHRPYRGWRAIPRLLSNIRQAVGPKIALGTVSKLAMFSEASHQEFHGSSRSAGIQIVDPEAARSDPRGLRFPDTSPRQLTRAPYLASGAAINVPTVLDMQRRRSANLLLTPGRALDASDPQLSLDQAFADGDEALTHLAPGERLALNLVMGASWLTRPRLHAALLAELLDQDQFDVWYLKVQWSSSLRSHTQPTSEELLRGYKRLAELAADEGRTLLLPQTGLTGWLMLAFGASGFGTGPGGGEQAFREESGGGGNGAPQIERYFEAALLHTVERTSRPVIITDPTYVQCTCPYCPSLFAGTAWSHELAGLHQVHSVAQLTAAVAPPVRGGSHGAVRRTVQNAQRFAQHKPLTGISEPRHLPVWGRVL